MRILMLGWEFPPFISGGLGTACQGLTRALSRTGVAVTFVLPRSGQSHATEPTYTFDSQSAPAAETSPATDSSEPNDSITTHRFGPLLKSTHMRSAAGAAVTHDAIESVPVNGFQLRTVDAQGLSPYARSTVSAAALGSVAHREQSRRLMGSAPQNRGATNDSPQTTGGYAPTYSRPVGSDPKDPPVVTWSYVAASTPEGPAMGPYHGDLFERARQYANRCVAAAAEEQFDVVHAHDWLAFPAGLAVAAAMGKPLVVHVHSTEFDRSSGAIDRNIYEIERRGVHGALRVIAVSRYTASILQKHYALEPHKIDVVYNGVDLPTTNDSNEIPSVVALAPPIDATLERSDKVVLFLGRITFQKGPGYFLDAAEQVLRRDKKVKFLIAGDGDKMQEIVASTAQRGLGGRVLFAGFLHGPDVERTFKMADVFVMPSVSEPFGLAALEAAAYGVPVVVSKNAGVAEVLTHVVRVDAWDAQGIAERILAVLNGPSLKKKLANGAAIEAKALTWDAAAAGCVKSYQAAIAMMPR